MQFRKPDEIITDRQTDRQILKLTSDRQTDRQTDLKLTSD